MSGKSGGDKGKPGTVRKIYALCFLAIMLIIGIVPSILLVQDKLSEEHTSDNNKELTLSEENDESDRISSGIVGKYLDISSWITDRTEQRLTMKNPIVCTIINLANISSGYSYGHVIYNGDNTFVKLPNGYLAGCFDYCPSEKAWNNVSDFSSWLEKNDIPFLHLITPDKGDDSITTFPKGIPHGYAQTLNEYKAFMDVKAVNYMESRPLLLEKNKDFYSWFYKSDHHWNVHAAYQMAKETADYLNNEFNIPADAENLDKDNYRLATYPDSFLGSYGKKLGDSWIEDFEIFYPENETDFHLEIPGYGIDKRGEFDDTLIFQERIDPENNSYCAFLGRDFPLVHIENKNCHNGTKALVIKCSFANALCPYLADTVRYLDMIDPKYFNGSIRSYTQQTKPDAVILCMGVVTEYDENYLQLK